MYNTTISSDNLVSIVDNQTTTTSLKIAEYFGKDHSKVLSKIKSLDCSQEFTQANFGVSNYIDDSGKSNPMYNITKDGFVFLTMGFTGAKASKFKEQYIAEFNRMEAQLKNQLQPTPQLSTLQIIELARESELGRLAAEKKVQELQSTNYAQQQSIAKRNELLSIKDDMIVNTINCKAGEFKTVSKQIDTSVGAENKTFIIELYAHRLSSQPDTVWDEKHGVYIKKYSPEQYRAMNKMAMEEYNSCHEDKYFGVKYKPSLQTRINYGRWLKQQFMQKQDQNQLQTSETLMLS
jgi:Rha family phage regulatory protein